MHVTDPAGTRPADLGWVVLAVLAYLFLVVQLFGTGLLVAFGPRGMGIVQGLGQALVGWWFAKGSWLRTRWGRPLPGTPAPWGEPGLTERRAWWYVVLGAGCVIAASLAIGFQALHWVD